MRIIQWMVIILLFVFWLAEDEMVEVDNSISEGEFEMSFVREVLDQESGACIEIGSSGSVIIGTPEQGSVTLSAQEAYSLLDALYRHVDVLRGRQDTVPLREEHAPNGSNYHDERCRCRGCSYDGPEPSKEESQRILAQMGEEPQAEQWQATATCQLDPKHTGRDVFKCDGCERMACNECGELVEDVWLCERCLAQEKVAYLF